MGLFSFLNCNNDHLASLRQITLALNGEKFDKDIATNLIQGQKITSDPEERFTDDFSKKTHKAIIQKKEISPLKAKDSLKSLIRPIQSLYTHLHTSQRIYSDSDLHCLANAADRLVRQIDKYQFGSEKDDLILAQQAKNDFRNACKILKTRDKIILGLIAAILSAAITLLAAPMIPMAALSVKVGLTTTAALTGALGMTKFAESLKSPLAQYNQIEIAVNSCLSNGTATNSPTYTHSETTNKYSKPPTNFSSRLTFSHNEMTEPQEDTDKPRTSSGWLFGCCR